MEAGWATQARVTKGLFAYDEVEQPLAVALININAPIHDPHAVTHYMAHVNASVLDGGLNHDN